MHSILVADDDPDILKLLRSYLEREGYAVDGAANGPGALEAALRKNYSLVVLDLMMPGMDGIEVCRRIRDRSNVPVIMLTAKGDETEKVLGLAIGADDYVTKPFAVHELVARIKAQVRRYIRLGGENDSGENGVLTYRGLSIDPVRRVVRKGDAEPELTAKEFDLLFFLAESAGRAFTKTQIKNRVWPDDAYVDDNTLMVHIRRLRKKIETDPDEPEYVLTVRNIGYKFAGTAP